jgi:ribulose-phosphate 3-epimerase
MTKKKIIIIPAILAKNKTDFLRQWSKVKNNFSRVQVDISDGIFVKTKTVINPQTIKNITHGYKLEIHLMVRDVPKYLNQWLRLKNVKKIIWHYEAGKNIKTILYLNKYLKKIGRQTSLALNPSTSLAKIKNIIKDFSTIQIMGVQPGRQGQRFQIKTLAKIKALRAKYPRLNITVDGGLNDKNFKTIKKAGATTLVIGSYLQKSKNLNQTLQKLK